MLRRAKADKAGRGAGPAPEGVLVVSDDEDACELMARLLEREGHDIERVHDDGSAMAALSQHPRRAVLVSFTGGSSTNLKLVDAIRSHPEESVKHTPVVLVTADEKNRVYSWQSGVDGFLVRPFHANDLVRTMAETLSRTAEERAAHRRAELKRAQTPSHDGPQT